VADAKRFQAWQLDALAAHPAGTELLTIGPFHAVIPATDHFGGWVTIVEGTVGERDIEEAVASLRSAFKRRDTEPEIEYNEALFPEVGPWLEAAGFTLAERNPLMACRPEGFKPSVVPDVTLHRLTPESDVADLQAFQAIRWTNGEQDYRAVPEVDRLKKELMSATSVYLLAWLDGEKAGTGVSHALNGAAEIVGVVTRHDKRGRGIAAAVTSNLITSHFAAGGDFVFLDAANDAARRVYERLGFKEFGANLVYR
jgi:ribosomal protein S18 acetylase RimI-like enzyme